MLSIRALALAAALTLALGGCRGGSEDDDDSGGTVKGPAVPSRTATETPTEEAVAETPEAIETPAPTVAVSRAVRYCAPVEQFFDITARIATCAEANELLTSGNYQWRGLGTRATDVDRYSCARVDRTSRSVTIRCTQGDATIRFSLDTRPAPAPPGSQDRDRDRDTVKIVGVCRKTAGWDAIAVTNVTCPDVQDDLRSNTDELVSADIGATVRLDSNFRCRRVDTSDAEDPAVRCVNRDASYDATYVGDPSDAVDDDDTIEHCAKTDGWDAITAKGVGCAEVEEQLEEHGDELLEAGAGDEVETDYECTRLDATEAEAPTIRCVDGDESYYAGYTEPE